MTDKEKIRKEIQRLQDLTMDENKNFYSEAAEGEYNALCNIEHFIDSLQEEPEPQFKVGDIIRDKVWELAVHEIVSMDDSAYYFENGGKVEIANQEQWELAEETVSVWHNASEEPNDMSHCLIFYGCKESVGHYLDYEPVLYNKKEKVFVTPSFPHPTGYKVEQKSIDGSCVAEVYKNRRDRILISDITQWCYLCDLHNLSNVGRIEKDWKEESVNDGLEEAAKNHAVERYRATRDRLRDCSSKEAFLLGYHQAEKDNELTWEDIKTIDKLLNQCVDYSNPYQEVLKRFKERKEK